MAGEFDATIDATVAGGEAATEGKYPWEWSVEEIATAAAQAGATAYCTAIGAGPAAPLCGMLAAEVMEFVIDNIVGPLGDAFGDLFGPGTEPPRLIQRDACNRGPYLTGMMDDYYTAFLQNAIGTHARLGLPGAYHEGEVMWALGVRGLEAPRRVSYQAWDRLIQNAPFPPDFSAEYAIYEARRLSELENATEWKLVAVGNPLFGTHDQYAHVALPMRDKCAMVLQEFENTRLRGWTEQMQRVLAQEIANLIEVAIALEIQNKARELALQNPQLIGNATIGRNINVASRYNFDDVSITAFDSQLRLVQPTPPADPVVQWIQDDPRNAPPYAWKGAA